MANGEEENYAGRSLPSLFFEGIGDLFSTMGTGVSEAITNRPRLVVDEQGSIRRVGADSPLHPSNRYVPGPIPAPVNIDRAVRAAREAQGLPPVAPRPPASPFAPETPIPSAPPAAAPTVDMSGILDLLPFAQTEAERAALEQSLADLEARASAGMEALGDVWGRVQSVNRAAKDKAASMVSQVGARAGGLWSNLAQAALEKVGLIAGEFGSPAGRQSINIDPTAGAQNYVALMGSLAPAYEMQARQSQERLARDLGFLSDMAGMQGAAYQGELKRTSMIQAADMARKHNEAVAERTSQNRLKAAELLAQARRTNATLAASAADSEETLSPLEQLVEQSALQRAAAEALAGRPDAARQLADITGIDLRTAQALVADVLANR